MPTAAAVSRLDNIKPPGYVFIALSELPEILADPFDIIAAKRLIRYVFYG
jgi:hypothetical protein